MLDRILLLILLTGLCAVHAADVGNLYHTEVVVSDQGQSERNSAIKAGLTNVLIKVTGNHNIVQQPAVQPLMAKASRYVQQYRYRTGESQSGAQATGSRRYLEIYFDKLAVDRELRRQGLPVWGQSRPQVLAWVGFDRQGKRSLLNPEFNPETTGQLSELAASRGIPFLMPLMDLQDQAAVSASDLWGTFEKPVRDASERYAADIILMVTIKSSGANYWTSNWSLIDGDDVIRWQEKNNRLNAMLASGINEMSDKLARAYAPAGGSQTENLLMQVSAVSSFEDLVRLQKLLDSQETVHSYQVRAIKNDQVFLALNLRGGVQAFTQAVNFSGVLEPEQQPLAESVEYPASRQNGLLTQQDPSRNKQTAALMPKVMPLVEEIQLYYRMR